MNKKTRERTLRNIEKYPPTSAIPITDFDLSHALESLEGFGEDTSQATLKKYISQLEEDKRILLASLRAVDDDWEVVLSDKLTEQIKSAIAHAEGKTS